MNCSFKLKRITSILAAIAMTCFLTAIATGQDIRLLRVKGTWPTQHNWSGITSGTNPALELREGVECSDGAGYRAIYEFNAPAAGVYNLWLIGTPPGADWVSPLQITLNGKKIDLKPKVGGVRSGQSPLNTWVKLATVRLNSGQNDLIALVMHRRQVPDNEFCFYLEDLVFAPLDWNFSPKQNFPLPEPRNPPRPEKTLSTFKIDAAGNGTTFPGIDFSISQGAAFWNKGVMDAVATPLRNLHPKYFRKDNFYPACTERNGGWEYDFSTLDRGVDEIIALGSKIIPCIEPSGPALRNAPVGQPFNLPAWEEYCYQIVKHFNVDRKLGIRYWEILNEPDGRNWYDAHYVAVFAAAQRGIRRADPTALVGGPASVGSPQALPFVRRCIQAGVKPDFISYHTYGVPGEAMIKTAQDIRQAARTLLNNSSLPLLITEWGITSTCCKYWWNSYAATFNASVYTAMVRNPGCPDIATQFMVKDIKGSEFGLFDLNNQPYPSYYAATLFWGMKGKMVPVSGNRTDNMDALAVRDGSTLQIYLWSMAAENSARQNIELRIANFSDRPKRWRRAVIDPYCTNPYQQRHLLTPSHELSWTPWQATPAAAPLQFELVPPSVTLIEVKE